MYCSNCGLPVAKGINFCPKCGRDVKQIKPKKPSSKISLPSFPLTGFLSRYAVYILILAVILFTLYFVKSFILEKHYEKISFGNKNTEEKYRYPSLNNIESKSLDEAKKLALEWAKDAQIYRFNVSIVQDEVLPSYYYSFFSPTDTEMEFTVSKSGNKPLKTETGKIYVEREKISQFPPKITALEASDLSLKSWAKIKKSEEEIDNITLNLCSAPV